MENRFYLAFTNKLRSSRLLIKPWIKSRLMNSRWRGTFPWRVGKYFLYKLIAFIKLFKKEEVISLLVVHNSDNINELLLSRSAAIYKKFVFLSERKRKESLCA